MNMQKIYRGVSGLCIGYSICHIFIQFFIVGLIFRPLDIRLGRDWGTDISSEQLLAILILGIVLSHIASGEEEKIFRVFNYIGMGIWIVVGILMEM